MPQEGMLLQLDGSHHAWLEDRGPGLTLLLAVDDATGTAPYALFQEQEGTRGYFSLPRASLKGEGSPWRCTPMGMRSFSLGEAPGSCPRFAGRDQRPNGVERWKNWGSPRYRPTAPRPRAGWSGPMAPSRAGPEPAEGIDW